MIKAFLIIFFLLGCATNQNRQATQDLKKSLTSGDVKKAIQLVENEKFYPEERSKLLRLLELATLKQINGDYYQSLKLFEKAQSLSDQLFTVSMSKKALAAITNNNMDNYYGEVYERSLIRFYIALNHYFLYQVGKYEKHIQKKESQKKEGKEGTALRVYSINEKILTQAERQFHLSGARSVMLEWDNTLSNYHSQLAGESTYKYDLSSRLFGAFIHQQIGTRSDLNTAIKLYEEAKDILFKNYNIYQSYNGQYKKFIKDYEKLPQMGKKKIEAEYIQKTGFSKDLLAFLDAQIKKLKSKKRQNNVTILAQVGYIAEKRARKIHIPIPGGAFHGSGKNILSFAAYLLNTGRGTLPSITFELPIVENKKVKKNIELIIKDDQGVEVARKKMVLMNPLSEIAYQTLDHKIGKTYAKIGARIALKHVAAIVAAYAVYKKNGKMAGQFIATAMYAVSNKAIAASEKADTRYWSTLPHSLRLTSLSLRPGKYSIFTKMTAHKKLSLIKVKDFKIEKDGHQLINLNLY